MKPHPLDPEHAMQEHASRFAELVCFAFLPWREQLRLLFGVRGLVRAFPRRLAAAARRNATPAIKINNEKGQR